MGVQAKRANCEIFSFILLAVNASLLVEEKKLQNFIVCERSEVPL